MTKVIVVGAGIAGLTAAYTLEKYGFDVQVIESASRVGGRMTTDKIDGYVIDRGAQFLSTGYSVLENLIFELGLEDEYTATSPWTAIQRDGVIRKFRYDDFFSPVKSGLLNWREWFKFGFGAIKSAPDLINLPVSDYSKWAKFDTENATSWYNRQYGEWMTEYIIEPMLEGFYFQSPDKTSSALPIAISGFLTRGAKTMTLKQGISSLPLALADKLQVSLNEKVEKISVEKEKVIVHTNRQEIETDKVILALPAHIAKSIYTSESEIEKALLNTSYSSTLNLVLSTRKDWQLPESVEDVYGLLIPRRERKRIVAIAFERAKDVERVREGQLLNIMLDSISGAEMVDWDEQKIITELLPELDHILAGISDNIVFHKLYRWKYAEPKSPVGRSRKIDKYRKTLSKEAKILLAGDYIGMPFTDGAAETGLWAASHILKNI